MRLGVKKRIAGTPPSIAAPARKGRDATAPRAGIASAGAFNEHHAHILGALPYLFLLACPFMHLFMHHDHGSSSSDGGGSERGAAP